MAWPERRSLQLGRVTGPAPVHTGSFSLDLPTTASSNQQQHLPLIRAAYGVAGVPAGVPKNDVAQMAAIRCYVRSATLLLQRHLQDPTPPAEADAAGPLQHPATGTAGCCAYALQQYQQLQQLHHALSLLAAAQPLLGPLLNLIQQQLQAIASPHTTAPEAGPPAAATAAAAAAAAAAGAGGAGGPQAAPFNPYTSSLYATAHIAAASSPEPPQCGSLPAPGAVAAAARSSCPGASSTSLLAAAAEAGHISQAPSTSNLPAFPRRATASRSVPGGWMAGQIDSCLRVGGNLDRTKGSFKSGQRGGQRQQPQQPQPPQPQPQRPQQQHPQPLQQHTGPPADDRPGTGLATYSAALQLQLYLGAQGQIDSNLPPLGRDSTHAAVSNAAAQPSPAVPDAAQPSNAVVAAAAASAASGAPSNAGPAAGQPGGGAVSHVGAYDGSSLHLKDKEAGNNLRSGPCNDKGKDAGSDHQRGRRNNQPTRQKDPSRNTSSGCGPMAANSTANRLVASQSVPPASQPPPAVVPAAVGASGQLAGAAELPVCIGDKQHAAAGPVGGADAAGGPGSRHLDQPVHPTTVGTTPGPLGLPAAARPPSPWPDARPGSTCTVTAAPKADKAAAAGPQKQQQPQAPSVPTAPGEHQLLPPKSSSPALAGPAGHVPPVGAVGHVPPVGAAAAAVCTDGHGQQACDLAGPEGSSSYRCSLSSATSSSLQDAAEMPWMFDPLSSRPAFSAPATVPYLDFKRLRVPR